MIQQKAEWNICRDMYTDWHIPPQSQMRQTFEKKKSKIAASF